MSDIRVDGLEPLVRVLLAVGADLEDMAAALSDIANEGARLVASEAPKRTGRLAGSAAPQTTPGRAAVAVNVPYGVPINYGDPGRGIAANPYLQRADAQLLPYALQRLSREIDTLIQKRGLA